MMAIAADHHPFRSRCSIPAKARASSVYGASKIKKVIPAYMQSLLDQIPNLTIKECEVVDLLHDDHTIFGVKTREGDSISSKAVIVTTGTYMNGRIISGRDVHPGGPDGEKPSIGLSEALAGMGLEIFRLKTGTPPRIKKSTIDFSKGEIQLGKRRAPRLFLYH
jgi:tRNA uridine 5-carboxymethylaminomethyl modification enzyme